MTIGLTDMAGTAVTVQVGVLALKMSPPTLGDMAELDRHIREQGVQKAKAFITSMGDTLPADGRWKFLEKVYEESKTSMQSAQDGSMGDNLTNTAYLIFLCARKNNQDLTYEEVLTSISIRDIEKLGKALKELTGGKASPGPVSPTVPEQKKPSGAKSISG